MFKIEDALIGQRVETVSCGSPCGSIFYLLFHGASSSFLVHCAWRLDKSHSNVTGWRELNEGPVSPLVSGLKQLEGATVVRALTSKTFTMEIHFDSGHELLLFADLTSNYGDEGDSNWQFNDKVNNRVHFIDRHLKQAERPYVK